MMSQSTYTGWDFAAPVWTICEGTDYPRLEWQRLAIPADSLIAPNGGEAIIAGSTTTILWDSNYLTYVSPVICVWLVLP